MILDLRNQNAIPVLPVIRITNASRSKSVTWVFFEQHHDTKRPAIDTPAQPAEEWIFNYLCPVLSPCTLEPQVPGTRTLISITLKATERGSACGVQLQSSCNYSACRNIFYCTRSVDRVLIFAPASLYRKRHSATSLFLAYLKAIGPLPLHAQNCRPRGRTNTSVASCRKSHGTHRDNPDSWINSSNQCCSDKKRHREQRQVGTRRGASFRVSSHRPQMLFSSYRLQRCRLQVQRRVLDAFQLSHPRCRHGTGPRVRSLYPSQWPQLAQVSTEYGYRY